jgi:DeoR/GlpR family transcriptional regulator of sugar metabolism
VKVAYEVVKARRDQLAQLLAEHQYLPLAEVCARLGISEATARRDLTALERDHAITRTYGGAVGDYNRRFDS